MRLVFAVLTVALGIAGGSSRGGAQGTQFVPAINEGDTLRVWAVVPRLNGMTGVLAGLRADTLMLGQLPPTSPPMIVASVPYGALRRIDVRRGKHRSAGRIVAGTLLGAAAGGLLGAAIGPSIECANDCQEPLGGLAGLLLGIGFGSVAGGVTGGVLGARRVARWETVRLR